MAETIGAYIKKALLKEGISREIEGISKERLELLELDEEIPTVSEAVKISKALEIPLEDILKKENYPETYIPSKKSANRILHVSALRKGDKINLNLPLSTVRLFITSGKLESYLAGGSKNHAHLVNRDELIYLLDAGAVGKLAEVHSDSFEIKITLK